MVPPAGAAPQGGPIPIIGSRWVGVPGETRYAELRFGDNIAAFREWESEEYLLAIVDYSGVLPTCNDGPGCMALIGNDALPPVFWFDVVEGQLHSRNCVLWSVVGEDGPPPSNLDLLHNSGMLVTYRNGDTLCFVIDEPPYQRVAGPGAPDPNEGRVTGEFNPGVPPAQNPGAGMVAPGAPVGDERDTPPPGGAGLVVPSAPGQ